MKKRRWAAWCGSRLSDQEPWICPEDEDRTEIDVGQRMNVRHGDRVPQDPVNVRLTEAAHPRQGRTSVRGPNATATDTAGERSITRSGRAVSVIG